MISGLAFIFLIWFYLAIFDLFLIAKILFFFQLAYLSPKKSGYLASINNVTLVSM